jgi:hypothetical protein
MKVHLLFLGSTTGSGYFLTSTSSGKLNLVLTAKLNYKDLMISYYPNNSLTLAAFLSWVLVSLLVVVFLDYD